MATSISAEELSRAKNQLKTSLLMNLESRPILFEDIGRQVASAEIASRPHLDLTSTSPRTHLDLTSTSEGTSLRVRA